MTFGPKDNKIKEIKFPLKIKDLQTSNQHKLTKKAHCKIKTNFKRIHLLWK